jgi:tyrosine-protein phosphatase non-receptor type 23
LRRDLKSHLSSLDAAAPSDQQIYDLWGSVKGDIGLLFSGQLDGMFAAAVAGSQGNLLEVEPTADEDERTDIAKMVDEVEERLGKLNKIAHERGEVLKDLKDKVPYSPMVTLELIITYTPGPK